MTEIKVPVPRQSALPKQGESLTSVEGSTAAAMHALDVLRSEVSYLANTAGLAAIAVPLASPVPLGSPSLESFASTLQSPAAVRAAVDATLVASHVALAVIRAAILVAGARPAETAAREDVLAPDALASYMRAFGDAWFAAAQPEVALSIDCDGRNVAGVRAVLASFAAALLTDGAVEAADKAFFATDDAGAKEDMKAGIRTAIRTAGVEPAETAAKVEHVTHTALDADSRQTICGLPREAAFLNVPASDGVTCVACLQGVGRAYSEATHRNLKDAIANRERAEKAEAAIAAEQVAHAKTRRDAERELDQVLASMPTDQQIAIWKNTGAAIADLEAVIDEMSRAAKVPWVMTPAARVRAMGEAVSMFRAEAEALRAEVAALRGLASEAGDYLFDLESRGEANSERMREVLATVPPAKVADAAKPEAPGLDPLPVVEGVSDFSNWRVAITERVNVLSAIAKRGGL